MLNIVILVCYVVATVGIFVQWRKIRAGWVAPKFKDNPAEFLARTHKGFKLTFVMFAVSAPIWLIMGYLILPEPGAIERFVLAGMATVAAASAYVLRSKLPAKIGG